MLSYRPITTNSNLEPLSIDLVRDGELVSFGDGATGSITIVDERTGQRLVNEAPVVIRDPGHASFVIPQPLVSKIERDGVWLVEWRIDAQPGLIYRSAPIKLPVHRKL